MLELVADPEVNQRIMFVDPAQSEWVNSGSGGVGKLGLPSRFRASSLSPGAAGGRTGGSEGMSGRQGYDAPCDGHPGDANQSNCPHESATSKHVPAAGPRLCDGPGLCRVTCVAVVTGMSNRRFLSGMVRRAVWQRESVGNCERMRAVVQGPRGQLCCPQDRHYRALVWNGGVVIDRRAHPNRLPRTGRAICSPFAG
jgi:hypothetical protein